MSLAWEFYFDINEKLSLRIDCIDDKEMISQKFNKVWEKAFVIRYIKMGQFENLKVNFCPKLP